MICSGVIVHLSEGLVEAHFHFFVMVAVISLFVYVAVIAQPGGGT